MKMLSPLFSLHMPASGDVWMDYKPWTNWGVTGNTKVGSPEIESGVFRDVALPGKQLGKLTDAVLALILIVRAANPGAIEQNAEHERSIDDLLAMASNISLKKADLKKMVEADALEALRRLNDADPDAFKSMINTLHSKGESALQAEAEEQPGS
jgi:hypothetical protein